MSGVNINRVVLTGNLTKDPELRALPSGTNVCKLRIAVNDRVKRGEEWVDVAYYFDVVTWGTKAENCARYLAKGRGVAVDGKLTFREWEYEGRKYQAVEVDTGGRGDVQFLSDGKSHGGGAQPGDPGPGGFDTGDFAPAGGGFSAPVTSTPDDDIPF